LLRDIQERTEGKMEIDDPEKNEGEKPKLITKDQKEETVKTAVQEKTGVNLNPKDIYSKTSFFNLV
jgi:hypothetical protein